MYEDFLIGPRQRRGPIKKSEDIVFLIILRSRLSFCNKDFDQRYMGLIIKEMNMVGLNVTGTSSQNLELLRVL